MDKYRYNYAKQICKGLKVIHNINYVHSDLKASNILVENIGGFLGLYISDFGGARLKGTWPICYTPGFAPANFFDKPICFEDDIYSLGKLLIELFGKYNQNKIGKINYDNYSEYLTVSMFSNVYEDNSDDYSTKDKIYDYVHECINEDSKKRPSLDTLLKFFEKINIV